METRQMHMRNACATVTKTRRPPHAVNKRPPRVTAHLWFVLDWTAKQMGLPVSRQFVHLTHRCITLKCVVCCHEPARSLGLGTPQAMRQCRKPSFQKEREKEKKDEKKHPPTYTDSAPRAGKWDGGCKSTDSKRRFLRREHGLASYLVSVEYG
ncbi:hypothetical protein LZ31DRAFT_324174 [Colletotrichum somersetense]|nr:hypothetical protein LZ31DRAFT_324174 [Colletotrichum somersetense]